MPKRSGFTFIEILVVIGVLALVAGLAVSAMVSLSQSFTKSRVIDQLQTEGTRVMEEMVRVIQESERLDTGVSDNSLIATLKPDSLAYQSNNRCLQAAFRLEPATASSNGYLTKVLSGGSECAPPASPYVLTSTDLISGVNVSAFTFTISSGGRNPQSVRINLVLQQAIGALAQPAGPATVSLENIVSTREY